MVFQGGGVPKDQGPQEFVCPYCGKWGFCYIVDSRQINDGCIVKRRRLCPNCNKRFTTKERYYPNASPGRNDPGEPLEHY